MLQEAVFKKTGEVSVNRIFSRTVNRPRSRAKLQH